MNKWYCVTSTFDDKGKVKANITSQIEAETKPENTFRETRYKDVYNDWFGNIEAKDFVRESKLA